MGNISDLRVQKSGSLYPTSPDVSLAPDSAALLRSQLSTLDREFIKALQGLGNHELIQLREAPHYSIDPIDKPAPLPPYFPRQDKRRRFPNVR